MTETKTPTESDIAQTLVESVTAFSRQMRSVKLPRGMTRERIAFLTLIDKFGPMSMSELADRANVRVPTASRMATSLVTDGLARKQPAKSDGRGILIATTAKGKKAIAQAAKAEGRHLEAALGKLSDGQRAALAEFTDALHALNAAAEHDESR